MSEILNYVPYQLCPKCQGEGEVPNCEPGCTYINKKPCDVCNGAKIIPMAVVSKYTIEFPTEIK